MFITPSFKKSLIVEQFQENYLKNRQHHSGGIYQQERGHPLPCSGCTSPRVVGSSYNSRNITDSSPYSGHSKCGSRQIFHGGRSKPEPNRHWTERSCRPFIRDSTHQKWTSASRLNHQVPKYVSEYPDPGALAVDAFLLDWSRLTYLIHPPVALPPRVLRKIK